MSRMEEEDTVTVFVESHEYHISKTLLTTHSEYFRAMFNGGFRESELREVHLEGVDRVSWERIIQYFKTGGLRDGDFEHSYYKENLRLLEATTMLGFGSLTDLCKTIISDSLNVENALDILRVASKLDWSDVLHKAKAHVFWHVNEVARYTSFFDLSLDEVEAYLSDPAVNCSTGEMGIWKAVVRWINSALDFQCPREIHLPRLIKCVSLKGLCVYDLLAISSNEHVKASPLVSAVVGVLIKEMAAEKGLSWGSQSGSLYAEKEEEVPAQEVNEFIESWRCMPPRKESLKPCMIHRVRIGNNSYAPSLVLLDEENKKLIPIIRLNAPDPRMADLDAFRVVRDGTKLYLFNGRFVQGSSNCHLLWKFDQINYSWQLLMELPEAVRYGSACVLDDCLYIMGGFGASNVIRSQVYKVSLSQKTMTECARAPVMFFSLPCCAYKKHIYLFERRAFQYSPQLNMWNILNVDVPDDVRFTNALANDEYIYLTDDNGKVFKLDPAEPPLTFDLIGNFTYRSVKACLVHNYIYSMTRCREKSRNDVYYEKFNVDTRESTVLWKKDEADEYIITEDNSHYGSFPLSFY